MLRKINASEIISCVKPEFAQFAKKVKYKPAEPLSSIYFPKNLREMDRYMLEQQCIARINSGIDEQIFAAKEAIESYAKQKNVTVEMTRRMNIVGDVTPKLKDQIFVSVYNPKTKIHEFEFVPVFGENQSVNTVKKSSRVFTNADGVEVVRPVQSEYEDNFVRFLYRNIENAVKRSFIQ